MKTLSLSIDEELVCAGCVDGSIRLFTVIDGQLVTTLANEHPRPSGKFHFYTLLRAKNVLDNRQTSKDLECPNRL